jgi:hypothetical protein
MFKKMIDFNQAISIIRRNGGFKPNRKDTSYYRTYTIEGNRPLQARVSNHGTWLWTWYDKDYDPSYAINFCVVFSENGEYDSDVSVDMDIKDEEGNVIGRKKSFEVIQYVYNCQILDDNDAALINQAVQNIWQNKEFKDPLVNTPKHAKVIILRPNETPEIITEAKHTNMNKKLIRLTGLDWRTYANAAKKRDAQIQQLGRDATDKGGNRLTHLRNNLDYAASDALTSKYAQRHNNGYPTNNADVYTKNGYQTVTTNNFDGNGRWSRGEFNYDNKGNIDKQGYNMNSQMDNEVEDYMKGKSKYIKGKGWQ